MRKFLRNYVEIRVFLLFFVMLFFSRQIFAYDYNISIIFYVQDEHGPRINSVVIEPANISMGDIVSVTVNATDTNKVNNVTVLILNSSTNISRIDLINQSINMWNSTWNSSNASKGVYYATIIAYDNLSNIRTFDHSAIIGIDISALKTYSNNSIALTSNNITSVNAYASVNAKLGIISQADIAQASVIMAYYPEDLYNKTISAKYSLGNYLDILVSDSVSNNLTQANIMFYYQESDYTSLGLDETTLKLYFWNTTAHEWTLCELTGVDVSNNFVWANITHLSTFSIFGSKLVIASSSPSSSSSGGGFMLAAKNKTKEPPLYEESPDNKEEKKKKETNKQQTENETKPQEEQRNISQGKEVPLISGAAIQKPSLLAKVSLQTGWLGISFSFLVLLYLVMLYVSKYPKISKKDRQPQKIILPKLAPKYYLYLENGVVIKNLDDLLAILKTIDKALFSHHVNDKKNDFAYWVKDVIGNTSLAEKLFSVRTRRRMIKILKHELK